MISTSITTLSKSIRPMLAVEMEEKLVKFNISDSSDSSVSGSGSSGSTSLFVQPKLDGIRCLIYKHNDKIVFQSRQNKLFEPFVHLLPNLEKIFKDHDIILDGELYCHGLGFESVTSMVRRAKTRHPDVEKINYVIYDVIDQNPTTGYIQRTNCISSCMMKNVFFIETIEVTTMKQIEDAHTHYTGNGYEGIMIRSNGPYKHGRSKDLLKYKKFKDSEYLVVGHTEGTGAHAGTAIFVCNNGSDKLFNVVMNGPLEKRRDMLKHVGDYYGKYLTVKYQELSTDGIPRFPIGLGFRID
jgi:DNA ligase-1